MKNYSKLATLILTGLFLLTVGTSMAQKGAGMMERKMDRSETPGFHQQYMMIPDLTEEQKEQIKELRVDQMKKMTQLRNQLTEKRAALSTLQTQDNPNMEEINTTIEEMGQIRISMHKEQAAHHQEIRKLLTEEQKAYFDAHRMKKRGNHRNKGMCPMKGKHFGPKQ